MLNICLFEFIFRTLPESIILVLSGYIFSDKKVNKKFYICFILLSIITYFIRMLPVHFGVHTIMASMFYVLMFSIINKTKISTSTISILFSSSILFLCECINVLILSTLFNINLKLIINNSNLKVLCGLPSLILFSIIIIVIYKSNNIKKMFSAYN